MKPIPIFFKKLRRVSRTSRSVALSPRVVIHHVPSYAEATCVLCIKFHPRTAAVLYPKRVSGNQNHPVGGWDHD